MEVDTWRPSALYGEKQRPYRRSCHRCRDSGLDLSKTGLPRGHDAGTGGDSAGGDGAARGTTPSQAEPTEPAVVDMGYTGGRCPLTHPWISTAWASPRRCRPSRGRRGPGSPRATAGREHPVDGGEKFHNGVDLAVNDGTHVKAFADGTVDYIGESPIYGLYTQIDHGNGVTVLRPLRQAAGPAGAEREDGDVIAESGRRARHRPPHLHFEIKKDGVLLNPPSTILKHPNLRWGRLEISGGFLLAAAALYYLDDQGCSSGERWPARSTS